VTTPTEIRLETQKGCLEATLLASTGTEGARQVFVVAGARIFIYRMRLELR
jgi:hypothetical protein